MRILLSVVLILSSLSLKAIEVLADTTFSGIYYGYNLYVINPVTPEGAFSARKVWINGRLSKDQLKSNAFEVDFSLMEVGKGKPVEVKIEFVKGYPPLIVNAEDLLPPDDFRFMNTNSRRGKLFWRVNGRTGNSPFVVEQYRWNKWVKVMEVEVSDTLESGLYGVDIEPHSGLNLYRIKKIDPRGQVVYSKDDKYRAVEIPEVNIIPSKDANELMFSYETLYEIYSANGKLLKRGKEKYVDISELPKGRYYINYDNKTETITKR
jgi:hypothetical protein